MPQQLRWKKVSSDHWRCKAGDVYREAPREYIAYGRDGNGMFTTLREAKDFVERGAQRSSRPTEVDLDEMAEWAPEERARA